MASDCKVLAVSQKSVFGLLKKREGCLQRLPTTSSTCICPQTCPTESDHSHFDDMTLGVGFAN